MFLSRTRLTYCAVMSDRVRIARSGLLLKQCNIDNTLSKSCTERSRALDSATINFRATVTHAIYQCVAI